MTDAARRGVAYIAWRLITARDATAAYDYGSGNYHHFSGDVGPGNVSVYDYDRSKYLAGSLPSLYDYAAGKYIQLDVSGESFSGYDYASRKHFSGTLNPTGVSVYDYETRAYHAYGVS